MSVSNAKPSRSLIVTTPSDLEILLTRVFEAPRHLVFEAMTKPEHIQQWWGPRGTTLSACEIDLRPGGAWRFVLRMANGQEVVFKGVYIEIVPPERLVSTECFDEPSLGSPEWLSTITLEERDGRTTFTNRILHKSTEIRNGQLGSGMEKGAGETFDRLAEYLGGMA